MDSNLLEVVMWKKINLCKLWCKENIGYKVKYFYSFFKLICFWFVNVCVSKLFSISL